MRVLFLSVPEWMVPAAKCRRWPKSSSPPNLRPCLATANGPLVSTAEHVLAALRGMGVDNATIEIDGPEVPIMDGSAAAFVAAIDQAGIVTQPAARRFIQVFKPVQVALGDSFGELRPHARGFRAEVEIDFTNPVIGRQSYVLELSPETVPPGNCPRPYLRLHERRRGAVGRRICARRLVRKYGGVRREAAAQRRGLRYADECARHKVLDVIGDLALAGLPLLGAYRSVRGGHKLNHAVLKALLADRTAWRVVGASRPRCAATPRPAAAWSAAWSPRPTVRTCPDGPILTPVVPVLRPVPERLVVPPRERTVHASARNSRPP